MLVRAIADTASVISKLLGAISLLCCGLVLVSFALFAHDQVAGASRRQQSELTAPAPVSRSARPKPRPTEQPRRFIDGAAGKLTAPFGSLVSSDNAWVTHGLSTVLALLGYGFVLRFLARWSQGTA
jgi:hypothetical protein